MSDRLQSFESRLKQSEQSQVALNKNVELKIRDLIIQMNKGFDSVQSSPQPTVPVQTFAKDYPQKGFVHKVEKGETVSSIAKKYSSKTAWIINANQIADPKKVFVGKELFVPQN